LSCARHGTTPCVGAARAREGGAARYQPKLTPTLPLDSPPPAMEPPINTAPLPGRRWA
jgi:hypothetical protein